jgi:hypothetical protein
LNSNFDHEFLSPEEVKVWMCKHIYAYTYLHM